ncbi:MAG: DeoR/GlpR family DNA-binding transcription regulator [Phycisphaerae bacterium]
MRIREQLILAELRNKGRVSVEDLAGQCDCSEVTIRRALHKLQEKGQIVRTSGGAIAVDHVGVEVAFPERLTINADHKQRIAHAAANIVQDNSVVMLDNGSSVYLMADFLNSKSNLTIITSFLPLVNKLSSKSDWRIIVAGGELRSSRSDLVGSLTEEFISRLYADYVFLGADGLDVEMGISTVDVETARLTKVLAKSAAKKILLADSSKLSRRATFSAIGWTSVDRWITDAGVDEDHLKKIRNQGVTVDIV